MVKKLILLSTALFGLLFIGITGEDVTDVLAQLEQAELYMKDGNYEQAEEIYQQIVTDYPGTDHAFQAQKSLTILYVTWDKQPQAEAAFQQLLASFSGHKDIAQAVHDIAYQYRCVNKQHKANQIDQYVIDNWPISDYAVLGQMDLAKYYVDQGDAPNAETAFNKLLADFSDSPLIARAVHYVGQHYRFSRRYEKANQLYQYVIDNWPKAEHAMWAEADLIKSNLALGNDAAAQAAVDKLLANFNDNPLIAQAVHDIAYQHRLLRKYEKANQLDQHVIDNWPQSDYAVLAQMDLAKYYVDQSDAAAEAAVDKLLANFSDNPLIARAIHDVAQHYSMSGKYEKANEHYQYVIDHWPQTEYAILSRANIGSIYIRLADFDAAQAILDELLNDFSDHPILPKAVAVMWEGYYSEALRIESEGIDVQPEWYYRKAMAECERIVKQLPETPYTTADACYFLAVCHERLGEYEEAIEFYQRQVNNWPDFEYTWHALFRIGCGYEKLKKSGFISELEANAIIQATYEQLLEEYPTCIVATHARAWLSRHQPVN